MSEHVPPGIPLCGHKTPVANCIGCARWPVDADYRALVARVQAPRIARTKAILAERAAIACPPSRPAEPGLLKRFLDALKGKAKP